MNDPLSPSFAAELARSLDRLVAAGLVESYSGTFGMDLGDVRLTREVMALLEAGRPPLSSPEFLALWERSDYASMRAWLREQAAELRPTAPPSPGQPWHRRGNGR